MNKMNKVGGEKILSIWWFFVLALVAGGIALGVFMFFSADIDVREVESGIMVNRVYDCLNNNGYLRGDVFLEDFDLYEECDINIDVFLEDGAGYYLNVSIFDGNINLFENHSRSEDLKTNCVIGQGIKTKNFPKCFFGEENFLYISEGVQKELVVKVLAVSDQKGRSLPLL